MGARRRGRETSSGGGNPGLSTARAALRVASLLARTPQGVRADEVAEMLGKSVSTAYNLLASLCAEGVATRSAGKYRLAPGFRHLVSSDVRAPAEDQDLAGIVDALRMRTHKRSYLAVIAGGRPQVVVERGLQGMPRIPGLGRQIGESAHGLALGKVVLALAPGEQLDRYLRQGLRAFTLNTITRPEALRSELRDIRRTGVATDREEFHEDFCCLAAPLIDDSARFLGALGISMSRRCFETDREHLEETLRDVAGSAPHGPRSSKHVRNARTS